MNLYDYLILIAVLLLVGFALFRYFRRKKQGGGCCGSCAECRARSSCGRKEE